MYLCQMSNMIKTQRDILEKLSIEQLNPMQEEAQLAIQTCDDVVLLSPTGTGKTLAFLLPLIAELDIENSEVQILIIVPSRELAVQIEQVIREMGAGFKTNAVYGGRTRSKEKVEIKHKPAILIGTPGRIADHLRRKNFSPENISSLVLDEFDKSLEVGFEEEMAEIMAALPNLKKKVLTSATHTVVIPDFVGLKKPTYVNYLEDGITQLKIKSILSPDKDKLETLVAALSHLGNQSGIIFCNFKDSIHRISDYLIGKNIPHGCYYGGMEQIERERTLIKFRNGTYRLIIATDLASRGLDIPEIEFILHYHLPPRKQEFIHRNGRTARMHNEGTAYILHWDQEELPDFIDTPEIETLTEAPIPSAPDWTTLFISGGRKDKISKGDIAGLCCKQGKLNKDHLGVIELKQDCAFVGVKTSKVNQLIKLIDNTKLKKKKVRVKVI
jgi:superfamily II DNA/RNA helicase